MYDNIKYYFEKFSKHGLESIDNDLMREKMQLANKISIVMIFVLQFYLTINFLISFHVLDFVLGQIFFVVAVSYFITKGQLKLALFKIVWGYGLSALLFVNSVIYKLSSVDSISIIRFVQPKLYLIAMMALIMVLIPSKNRKFLYSALATNFGFLLLTDLFDYFYSVQYLDYTLISNDMNAIAMTTYFIYVVIFLIVFYFRQNLSSYYDGVINENRMLQDEYKIVVKKFNHFKGNYEKVIKEIKGKEDYYHKLEKIAADLLETEKAFNKIKESNSEILNPMSRMMNDRISDIRHKIKDIITNFNDIDMKEVEKMLKQTYADIIDANEIIFELLSWVRSNNDKKKKQEKVNIVEICKNQVYKQRFSLQRKGMEVDSRYRENIDVKIQKKSLENIIRNVLNLVINMGDENTKVSISTERGPYNFIVNVSIPSTKKIIFSEYDPNSEYPKEDALNLKYKVSKQIIQTFGGQLTESYNYNNLLTIEMNLPLN